MKVLYDKRPEEFGWRFFSDLCADCWKRSKLREKHRKMGRLAATTAEGTLQSIRGQEEQNKSVQAMPTTKKRPSVGVPELEEQKDSIGSHLFLSPSAKDDGVGTSLINGQVIPKLTTGQGQAPVKVSQDPCLLIHLTTTQARVSSWNEIGSVTPLPQKEADLYSIPLLAASIKQRFFVFGNEVQKYMKMGGNVPEFRDCNVWNLGKYLQGERLNQRIVLNENYYNVNEEVLFGLFFKYLKSYAETSLETIYRKMVLCVPLWFDSVVRHRLKDSGKLAGFQDVTVANESTALMLMHLSSSNLKLGTRKQFLVFCENSGNVDVLFYQSVAGLSLEMVACAGSVYNSSKKVRDLIKKEYQESKSAYWDIHQKKQARETMIQTLLEELAEKLPKNVSIESAESLLLCENREWKDFLETANSQPLILYEQFGAPPVNYKGSVVPPGWTPPSVTYKNLAGNLVKELLPFGLFRTDIIYTEFKVRLTESDQVASDNTVIKAHVYYPTTRTSLFQQSVSKKQLTIGTITLSRVLHYMYSKLEFQFSMNKEGILNPYPISVIAFNFKGMPVKTLTAPEDFTWEPKNVTSKQMEEMIKEFEEITRSSMEFQTDMVETKEKLLGLCGEMCDLMGTKALKSKIRSKRRDHLRTRIKKIKGALVAAKRPLVDLNREKLTRWSNELDGFLKTDFKAIKVEKKKKVEVEEDLD